MSFHQVSEMTRRVAGNNLEALMLLLGLDTKVQHHLQKLDLQEIVAELEEV